MEYPSLHAGIKVLTPPHTQHPYSWIAPSHMQQLIKMTNWFPDYFREICRIIQSLFPTKSICRAHIVLAGNKESMIRKIIDKETKRKDWKTVIDSKNGEKTSFV